MSPLGSVKIAREEPASVGEANGVYAATHPDTEVSTADNEIALVRRATEVLGVDHVAAWMRSNIPSLGNHTPYELIQTPDGRTQIERVLLRIEHGVY